MPSARAADVDPACVPRLRPGVRLRTVGPDSVLLVPEGVVNLSATAGAIVAAIDGSRSVADIVALMADRFDTQGVDAAEDVSDLLGRFSDHAWIAIEQ
ncbi:MAG TPA: pyrroloquinoline quinone biosynthesis peptide chaperone PqqD [Candidatus Eremiobacteraceae bacterium]|nr:pyrroloquinoline quinone biosynthesis peptide chaperone PqqD [Candidatus Eremiobacteraceae bacterium]